MNFVIAGALLLLACAGKQPDSVQKPVPLAKENINAYIDSTTVSTNFSDKTNSDPDTVNIDTAYIKGNMYLAILRTDSVLVKGQGKYLFKLSSDGLYNARFYDFDADGYEDMLFEYMGNNLSQEVWLFEPSFRNFKQVEEMINYPEALKIKGTPVYYSYHRSGCADLDWNSDLFYIKNFKAIFLGDMAGFQCNDRYKKDGIYIYSARPGDSLVEILPIDTIGYFKDHKWGFIEHYWKNNWKKFYHP